MEKEIKVSVLIPVYGVEKYIEKCTRSLFEQTMQDGIEFIFTDDCTPDRSIDIVKELLNEYPDRKSQVRFIRHKENMGLAEARVTGLNAARGEYVIHCDSDDWVDSTMYEKLYNEAKRSDVDIVGCDSIHVFPEKEVIRKENFNLPKIELVTELILDRKVGAYLWNKLIRRSFYLNGQFRAKKGTTLLEDMAVTVPMHASTDKVAYLPLPLYFYRRTDINSMSAGLSDRNVDSAVNVLLYFLNSPLHESWVKAVNIRLRSFLFSRILSLRGRNVNGWRKIEYTFLKSNKIELTPSQRIAEWLAKNSFDKSLFAFMLANKFLNPYIWKKRLQKKLKK